MNDPILDFIADFHKRNGYAPSVREIAESHGLAVSTVQYRLGRLEKAGRIRKQPNRTRTVVVA